MLFFGQKCDEELVRQARGQALLRLSYRLLLVTDLKTTASTECTMNLNILNLSLHKLKIMTVFPASCISLLPPLLFVFVSPCVVTRELSSC